MLHRLVQDWSILIIDPFRLETRLEGDWAAPLVPVGFENEAHLMPLAVHLKELDPVQQGSLLGWLDQQDDAERVCSALMFADGDATGARLKAHLGARLIVRRRDGGGYLFRYFDPDVARHFDWLFDEQQRAALFGPCVRWAFAERGQWKVVTKPETKGFRPLVLDDRQSASIERIGALNAVLADVALPDEAHARHLLFKIVDGYLTRAQQRGWQREPEWVAFAKLCLSCHPRFDAHPRVAALMEQAREDESAFDDAVRAVDDGFWDSISADMSAADEASERVLR